MAYVYAALGIFYFFICYFRLGQRYKTLDSMIRVEKLEFTPAVNESYFVMVKNMEYLEMENVLRCSKKAELKGMKGVIIDEEEYYHAEDYGNNFITYLNIEMLPAVITRQKEDVYLIQKPDGSNKREVTVSV